MDISNLSISKCYETIELAEKQIGGCERSINFSEENIRKMQNGPSGYYDQKHIDWNRGNINGLKAQISFLQSEIRRIQNRIQQLSSKKVENTISNSLRCDWCGQPYLLENSKAVKKNTYCSKRCEAHL